MEMLGYNRVDQKIAEIVKTYAANKCTAGNVNGMVAQMPMAKWHSDR